MAEQEQSGRYCRESNHRIAERGSGNDFLDATRRYYGGTSHRIAERGSDSDPRDAEIELVYNSTFDKLRQRVIWEIVEVRYYGEEEEEPKRMVTAAKNMVVASEASSDEEDGVLRRFLSEEKLESYQGLALTADKKGAAFAVPVEDLDVFLACQENVTGVGLSIKTPETIRSGSKKSVLVLTGNGADVAKCYVPDNNDSNDIDSRTSLFEEGEDDAYYPFDPSGPRYQQNGLQGLFGA